MGSAGIGTGNHLFGALFGMMTGINMIHVPYRGEALAFTDLLGGQVQVVFGSLTASIEHIKTGKLVWSYQGYQGDAYIIGCSGTNKTENCPKNVGPDADIGSSIILKAGVGGKRMLIASMKDGTLFALDPDKKGAMLWKTNIAVNPQMPMSGVAFGGAADDKTAYYGLSGGGVVAVQLATGEKTWFNPLPPQLAATP